MKVQYELHQVHPRCTSETPNLEVQVQVQKMAAPHLKVQFRFVQEGPLVQDSFLFLTLVKINIQPFTNNFRCADIHELLSPDLLHQIIQGKIGRAHV